MSINIKPYRIAWKYDLTGVKGCGEYIFSKKDADDFIKDLNKRYKNEISHWIEEKKFIDKIENIIYK